MRTDAEMRALMHATSRDDIRMFIAEIRNV